MRTLSALDAAFIYLESEHSPMAIGGIYVIDANDAPEGFCFERWRDLVKSRLRLSSVFRERLVEVPWDLSFPYWINDPDFDLENHLPNLRLPGPGGIAELMQVAANTWGQLLDRQQPLWEISFVEGLDNIAGIATGSHALITKVHHAALDGRAGNEMLSALMDLTPATRTIEGEDSWEPEALPSTLGVITRSWSRAGQKALDLAGFVGSAAVGAANLSRESRLKKVDPPPRLLSAPPSIFNQPIATARTYWGRNFDFERIKAIRKTVPGVTINDVVLAICAGGLRSYLDGKGELPDKPLVAMAPISVRAQDDDSAAGNQVSAMLVSLATNTEDPVLRLLYIRASTQRSKVHASALPANRIMDFLPSEALAAASRLYTRTRLGGQHRPFFNITITNVPGPPVPLYVAGARVHSTFGMAPILDGLGLNLVVFSYDGRISIGISSCDQIVPDPENMAECLTRSLDELEHAVSQADPAQLGGGQHIGVEESRDSSNPLKAFNDASEALDKAIDSLEE